MKLGHASDKYLLHLQQTRTLSPHTLRAYQCDLRTLRTQLGPQLAVTDLTADAILNDLQHRRESGTSIPSLKRRASTYRGFCHWLHKHGAITTNPWATLTIQLRAPRRLPRPVTESTLHQLLHSLHHAAAVGPKTINKQLPEPHHAVTLTAVSIMLATGLRAAEVVSIQLADLDLDQGSIRVLGKGQRERQVYLTNPWITELVTALIATRHQLAITHAHLLFNQHGNPLSTSALRSRIARAAQDAEIGEHVTPHMLRHTAATQLIDSAVAATDQPDSIRRHNRKRPSGVNGALQCTSNLLQ